MPGSRRRRILAAEAMFNPEIFAVNFARTVDLLRERLPNKETQKASLRAVYALTSLASATVRRGAASHCDYT